MDKIGKLRRIVVVLFSIIYLILIVSNVEIPKDIYIIFIGTILASQAIYEWNRYKERKNKVHLIIPVMSVVIIFFVILKLMDFK